MRRSYNAAGSRSRISPLLPLKMIRKVIESRRTLAKFTFRLMVSVFRLRQAGFGIPFATRSQGVVLLRRYRGARSSPDCGKARYASALLHCMPSLIRDRRKSFPDPEIGTAIWTSVLAGVSQKGAIGQEMTVAPHLAPRSLQQTRSSPNRHVPRCRRLARRVTHLCAGSILLRRFDRAMRSIAFLNPKEIPN
jgi:hypothetical protein